MKATDKCGGGGDPKVASHFARAARRSSMGSCRIRLSLGQGGRGQNRIACRLAFQLLSFQLVACLAQPAKRGHRGMRLPAKLVTDRLDVGAVLLTQKFDQLVFFSDASASASVRSRGTFLR